MAGIRKAQLVAAEQRGAQASADLALASLRGRDRYQPKHLGRDGRADVRRLPSGLDD